MVKMKQPDCGEPETTYWAVIKTKDRMKTVSPAQKKVSYGFLHPMGTKK